MTKSANENWCGLKRNGATHSDRMDTQKYVTQPVQRVNVTYNSITNVLIPR